MGQRLHVPEVHQPHQPLLTFTTRTVNGLATREYAGEGPALVLMHGAGMEQGSLEQVATRLPFRVITFDFPGHGQSAAARWTVASAIEDLSAVIDGYGLTAPAVGGHSLGGMVAVAYAAERPAAAVINIDGHGRGRADQYPGYGEDEVRAFWVRQDARLDGLTSGPVSSLLRGLLVLLGKHPVSMPTARQVTSEAKRIDLVTLYRKLSCPLLVFNAIAAEDRALMKKWAGEGLPFSRAYRQGLQRDLAVLAAERPQTEIVTADAPHILIRTHPDLVAERITAFLQPSGT